jgi:flagellar biosynthesis GTPase FlhF
MRARIVDIIVQIIPVMIGVFLAFLVSDCSEETRIRQKRDQMVEMLTTEVSENKKKIEQVIDYHKMLLDSTSYYAQPSRKLVGKPNFFKGVRTITLSHGAYQSALQTGLISELDLEQIQMINELYQSQEAYNNYNNMILEGLVTQDFVNPNQRDRVLRFLSVAMYDVVVKERDLLVAQKQVVELLR